MSSQAQQAREAFGARLRDVRKDAGLTGRELAQAAGWQLSKVSRIEHGQRNAKDADIRTWARLCGVDDQIPDLIATARNIEAMWLEWRRSLRAGTQARQRQSINLYAKTTTFRAYHPTVVWGGLQTAEYAAAVLGQVVALHGVPDDVDQGVQALMERQQYLYRGERNFSVLLGEQAVRTNIGGAGVMRGQLDRLLVAITLPRVSLGIIPAHAPCNIFPGNAFIMFDAGKVVVETYSAELTVTQPGEVAVYTKVFAMLQQSAVYGTAARDLITRSLSELD